MREMLWLAVGGGVGTLMRFSVSLAFQRWFAALMPWGTLCVNLVGSFCLGFLMHVGLAEDPAIRQARLYLGTGLLGGFTTFSTFAFEAVMLAKYAPSLTHVALYVLMQVGGGIAAAWLGWLTPVLIDKF